MTHGPLPGIAKGARFRDRRSLRDAGVHRDIRRGICGSGIKGAGAESVVLSGGYEDDIDLGDVIYYTGMGGRDRSGRQISHQEMTNLNRSLAENVDSRVPIRVIRADAEGYSYGGLYLAENAALTQGRSGYLVCRYRLRSTSWELAGTVEVMATAGLHRNRRRATTHLRLVRDGAVPAAVKRLYDYACQICGIRLETIAGPYAEGAHLLPLGGGTDGPDILSNVLCLCPNHHVLLDNGAIYLDASWRVIDREGAVLCQLTVHPRHSLDPQFARSHRELFNAI